MNNNNSNSYNEKKENESIDEKQSPAAQITQFQPEISSLQTLLHEKALLNALPEQTDTTEIAFQKVQQIKNRFNLEKFKNVDIKNHREVMQRATEVISRMIYFLAEDGIRIDNMEPGHGVGHLLRDYVNGLRLVKGLENEIESKHLFIGLLAGVFHDIGCAVVKRYEEQNTPIRHGETSGLLMTTYGKKVGLNQDEIDLLSYACAAHTHYLTQQKTVNNGKEYITTPYQDLDENGQPIYAVWIPRWIDRLDCSGPTFVGRHMHTLIHDHSDFDGKSFYEATFAEHMNPVIRTSEEIKKAGGKRTMLEHLNMFANSQTNESAYGKHDFGAMITIRDAQKERLKRIIGAVCKGAASDDSDSGISDLEKSNIICAWEDFLGNNVEPSQNGKVNAASLMGKFAQLPEKTQKAWIHGFRQTLIEFQDFGQEIRSFLDILGEKSCQYQFLKEKNVRDMFVLE